MTVGQRIAQKRKELGLSQEALGDRLGVFSALPPSSRINTGAPPSVPACLIFWMKPEKSLPGRMRSILIPTHPTGNSEGIRKRPDL